MGISKRIVSFALAAAMLVGAGAAGVSDDSSPLTSISITASAASGFTSKTVTVKSDYASTKNSVTISWKKISDASGYRIYRKDRKTGKFVKIKTIKDSSTLSFTDTGLSSATRYVYKVKAYKKYNGKNYWSNASKAKYTATKPKAAPEIKSVSESGKKVTVKWSKVKGSGYQLYCAYGNSDDYTKIATIKNADTTSFTINLDEDWQWNSMSGLKFKVRAYKTDEAGGVVKTKCGVSETYYPISTIREYFADGIATFKTATKGSRNLTYKIYNTQGSKTTSNTCYISNSDKKILKKFAAEHFKSTWSSATKIAYTINWINKNVTYVYGSEFYALDGVGYADAIFNKKVGQCIQYNGALVEMINYLGYEANLIQGYYKNTSNQHFWAEMKINGKKYVLEAGNYGKNGDWMNMCVRYKDATNYIRVSYGD
ncbi:MAG: hypothetical protein LUE12_05365 [Ruminococcus sp.]|nr:hypothetical protein [Ruminococcus sp.]